MLNDLTPIVIDMPSEDFVVYPLGDMHIGSREFMEKECIEFINRIKDMPNAYVMIIGDCIDNGLKDSVTSVYTQTMMPAEQKDYLYNLLNPIKDKIICGVGGNHERRSVKNADNDPLYDVFCRMDIANRYRPTTAFPILRVNGAAQNVKSTYRPTYIGCVTHGSGNGGKYIGSSANNISAYGNIIDGIDFIVMGHTHKPVVFPSAKLMVDARNKQIIQKQFTCVIATSWLRYGGYPLEKMLPPAAHKITEMQFSGNGKDIKVRL